jgi:hypothetical protein
MEEKAKSVLKMGFDLRGGFHIEADLGQLRTAQSIYWNSWRPGMRVNEVQSWARAFNNSKNKDRKKGGSSGN